ncbi:hypothetical protein HAX54_048308, partial [Datura stramonium]|nr:hypothetical protein [Datura stramonium]
MRWTGRSQYRCANRHLRYMKAECWKHECSCAVEPGGRRLKLCARSFTSSVALGGQVATNHRISAPLAMPSTVRLSNNEAGHEFKSTKSSGDSTWNIRFQPAVGFRPCLEYALHRWFVDQNQRLTVLSVDYCLHQVTTSHRRASGGHDYHPGLAYDCSLVLPDFFND